MWQGRRAVAWGLRFRREGRQSTAYSTVHLTCHELVTSDVESWRSMLVDCITAHRYDCITVGSFIRYCFARLQLWFSYLIVLTKVFT